MTRKDSERRKAYYQAHKGEIRARNKAYREAHKEEVKAYSKAYYTANKERLAALSSAWQSKQGEDRRQAEGQIPGQQGTLKDESL